MENLLTYDRVRQLMTVHPDWVDGCTKCPSPNDKLMMRATGFLLRDLGNALGQSKLVDETRKLGLLLVVKSATKGDKSLVVSAYKDDPCPMNPHYWRDLIWKLAGIRIKPERIPGPRGILIIKPYLNEFLAAESFRTLAQLIPDAAISKTVGGFAKEVGLAAAEKSCASF